MNFLGGDARHSALVKGLDYALLAQQKAKLKDNEIDDDDLEGAYGDAASKKKETKGSKGEDKKPASKFRPIGKSVSLKPVDEEKIEEGAEYIWRNGKRMRKKKKKPQAEESQEVTSTSIRSKSPSNRDGDASSSKAGPSSKKAEPANVHLLHQQKTDRERVEMPPPQISSLRKAAMVSEPVLDSDKKVSDGAHDSEMMNGRKSREREEESIEAEDGGKEEEESSGDDDSVDIFADAGRWNGLDDDDDDDSDSDDGKSKVAQAEGTIASSLPSSGKRDWFSSGIESQKDEDKDIGSLPSNLKNILDNAQEAQISKEEDVKKRSSDTKEGEDDDNEEKEDAKPQRLEGFSDSILGREGVRYMLEKQDDDKGGDRKRKRKRSKKGKGGNASD